MVPPFEPTPLEWRMMADAAEILGMTGDPGPAQAFLDLSQRCRENYRHREPPAE
jgi:hypothetical protein